MKAKQTQRTTGNPSKQTTQDMRGHTPEQTPGYMSGHTGRTTVLRMAALILGAGMLAGGILGGNLRAETPKTDIGTVVVEYKAFNNNHSYNEFAKTGNFYYNDAGSEPKVGEDKEAGVRYIEITGKKQDPCYFAQQTEVTMERCTKVPPNAPKAIKLSFQYRTTIETIDTSWGPKPKLPQQPRTLHRSELHQRSRPEVDQEMHGRHQRKMAKRGDGSPHPQGAETLRVSLHARIGQHLALGNWHIE